MAFTPRAPFFRSILVLKSTDVNFAFATSSSDLQREFQLPQQQWLVCTERFLRRLPFFQKPPTTHVQMYSSHPLTSDAEKLDMLGGISFSALRPCTNVELY